uniref:Transposon protein, CACTA, En/Spm sub-class n=1 Tax=Solanum tuberosum TaxID=4113 RepID=M1BFP5_SOLTU
MQACIPPGALARGRGKSLKSMGFKRVMAEETTPIGQNKNLKASTYQKEPAQNVIVVPFAFDPNEDDGPLSPEVEVMQDIQTNEIKSSCWKSSYIFVRHLGILVRDRNMCPLRVHSWMDIEKDKLEHMWNAVTVEIQKLVQSDSSLTNIEVVEKCFGLQRKSHVIGFGGGITSKELKGGNSSKAALLDKLNASEKENELLKKRMDELENKCQRMDELERKYEQLASVVFGEPTSTPSCKCSVW